MNKSWIYVVLTCLLEVIWVYGFNTAETWWEWILIIATIFLDYHILPKACAAIPTGTVYAIFSGVGTISTVLMDVFLFGEKFNNSMLLFIILIVIGVIGLNLADNKAEEKTSMKGAA
ncbi:SMR family transporter [Neobacillus sp. OS1-32]|jgi:paired small multidrug resistance pump|uniref:QacE family quaternary ammonium compound efflux SMR transporter n=1 Tax=Neobacillus paridis TaxID=2803862 RepID=A0ABS1TJY6_9BACI|nr:MULTISPECIES: SMR family transporter [Neobacillus]MBL4951498.1 QacE family quaternary ammonium compound efflux SMR transporter [Neobacillus paridis]WML28771.1 SMR family transporter [Neobacillus sp. OS1-32]